MVQTCYNLYMYYYIGLGFIALLVIWTIGSYLVIRNLEEPKFAVLESNDGYDIREYEPYIIAETDAIGSYDEATRNGFRVIADYIFGNNTSRTSIAMTTPVLESKSSEKIAMTVPVIDTAKDENSRTISFVLPSQYTLETLPMPNNPQVKITQVPSRKVAVLSFTWYPTAKRVDEKKNELLSLLAKAGLEVNGEIQVARYNPPLSMPLMLRNEIIIPIK
jgi:SOUL heme-binding protein